MAHIVPKELSLRNVNPPFQSFPGDSDLFLKQEMETTNLLTSKVKLSGPYIGL